MPKAYTVMAIKLTTALAALIAAVVDIIKALN
jgi:hypothetical protein